MYTRFVIIYLRTPFRAYKNALIIMHFFFFFVEQFLETDSVREFQDKFLCPLRIVVGVKVVEISGENCLSH